MEAVLDGLYRDYEFAVNGGEDEVCRRFCADSRCELVKVIADEIDLYEGWIYGDGREDEDDGMDYAGIQMQCGKPVIYW